MHGLMTSWNNFVTSIMHHMVHDMRPPNYMSQNMHEPMHDMNISCTYIMNKLKLYKLSDHWGPDTSATLREPRKKKHYMRGQLRQLAHHVSPGHAREKPGLPSNTRENPQNLKENCGVKAQNSAPRPPLTHDRAAQDAKPQRILTLPTGSRTKKKCTLLREWPLTPRQMCRHRNLGPDICRLSRLEDTSRKNAQFPTGTLSTSSGGKSGATYNIQQLAHNASRRR